MDIFKNRLRELRESESKKQSDIAETIGTSVQNYSAFERGREPNYDTLVKIADHFDVSVDYLLGRIPQKNHENVAVSEAIGLREEAIDILKNEDESIAMLLSMIIEHKDFTRFMLRLMMYINVPSKCPIDDEIPAGGGWLFPIYVDELYYQVALKYFADISQSIRDKLSPGEFSGEYGTKFLTNVHGLVESKKS